MPLHTYPDGVAFVGVLYEQHLHRGRWVGGISTVMDPAGSDHAWS